MFRASKSVLSGTPSVAFLVLAHRGPDQLGRLVRRLLARRHRGVPARRPRTAPACTRRSSPRCRSTAAAPARPRLPDARGRPGATWRRRCAASRRSCAPRRRRSTSCCSAARTIRCGRRTRSSRFLAEHRGRTFVATLADALRALRRRTAACTACATGTRPSAGAASASRSRAATRPASRPYGGSAFMMLDRATARAVLDFTRERPDVAATTGTSGRSTSTTSRPRSTTRRARTR